MSVALPSAPAVSPVENHLPAAECLRRHPGLTRAKLYRLVVGGEVRAILPPGKAPRYNVSDLDRIMADRDDVLKHAEIRRAKRATRAANHRQSIGV
jgi:hypothetical protein